MSRSKSVCDFSSDEKMSKCIVDLKIKPLDVPIELTVIDDCDKLMQVVFVGYSGPLSKIILMCFDLL